jgi:hypothetical protein
LYYAFATIYLLHGIGLQVVRRNPFLARHFASCAASCAAALLLPSAAKLWRDAGESLEEVSRIPDHSSLTATTTYLRRLEGQEDRSWEKVAPAIGL